MNNPYSYARFSTNLKLLLLGILFLGISTNSNAATYFSFKASAPFNTNFSATSNWNTATNGSGSNPVAGDLTSGLHTFIIQNGYTVTVDQDIEVLGLQVGTGTATNLVVGNNTTARTVTIGSGGFSVSTNGTVAVGAFDAIHILNLAGNLTVNGSLNLFTSATRAANTIISGSSVVSGAGATLTFNNLNLSPTAAITATRAITVNNNFIADVGSTTNTNQNFVVNGNFTLPNGATYTQSANTTTFSGTTVQTIEINQGATFFGLTFSNGGVNAKTIIGDITASSTLAINAGSTVTGSGTQTLRSNATISGTCNFSGTVNWESTGNISGSTPFSIGTAVSVFSGIKTLTGGTWNVENNLTIISGGGLILNSGTVLNNPSALNTLSVEAGGNLHMRGSNNFPTNFNTYSFATASNARYDANLAQTIRGGITYGNLILQQNIKTVDGSLVINGNITFSNTVSPAATLALLNFDHTFNGSTIVNNTTADGSITSTSGGTFRFAGADVNQTLNGSDGGTYTFHNLVFSNPGTPTALRTKAIQQNCIVNGDITIDNALGDTINLLVVNIGANQLTKAAASGTLSAGAFTAIYTSGTSNFDNTVASFTTLSLAQNSIVRFFGTTQNIPGITYGTIEILGTGTKTVTGALDINGNLTRIANNATINLGAFNHTLAGDLRINSLTLLVPSTSTLTLDGTNQSLLTGTLNNLVISGSATKTLVGGLNINGDLTINNGTTFDANIRSITLLGNFINSGTGVFTQTTGTVTFNGTSATPQTISTNPASAFGSVFFNRPNASTSRTIQALSNFRVATNCSWGTGASNNSNVFDLNGFTVQVAGNWSFQGTSSSFLANNGTLEFNGAGTATQLIQNINAGITYQSVVFSNSASKSLTNNTFNISGNVTINTGASVSTGVSMNIGGNWNNNGVFNQTGGTVTFNGGNQTISTSNFQGLTIAGSNTKTLTGDLNILGNLTINNGATLDVSASNFTLNVDNNFLINTGGVFVPRNGTVFINNVSTLNTGGTGAGQQFFNLNINSSPLAVTASNAIRVNNNLTVLTGTLAMGANNLFIGGSVDNQGSITFTTGVLTFEASSGTKTFNPGTSSYGPITVNAPTATIQLTGPSLSLAATRVLTITNGTLDLNGNTITTLANAVINGGTLNVSAGSNLRIGAGFALQNNGGTFRLVGTSSNPASLSVNGAGNFTFSQTSGTLEALHYNVSNTSGTGLVVSGGTIHSTNNLSNGNFSNGASGAGTSYLNLTGLNFSDFTATGVVFNAGPVSNITRTSGTGLITFQDAQGTLAGNSFKNAADSRAIFTAPAGTVTWDGGAGDGLWTSAANWSDNQVPTASTLVYLNHASVSSTYTVIINSGSQVAGRIVLDAQGGNSISLVLNGGTLAVSGSVTIGASTTLTQTNPADAITVSGSWFNNGTFNEGTSTVTFSGTGGAFTINTLGAADPFNNLTINAAGTTYTLGNTLDVNGNFNFTAGTFNVGGFNITASGNWTQAAINTTFIGGTNTVTLDGTGTQNISGGRFANLTTSSSVAGSNKSLLNSLTIGGNLIIGTNTILNAGEQNVNISGNWTNNVGAGGFTQTGVGGVYVNGAAQTIGAGATTTFQNLYLAGSGTKILGFNATVNGNLAISNTLTQVDINAGVSITGTGSGSFTQDGGILRVLGSFPSSFGTYTFTAGTVNYAATGAQNVQTATYNNLTFTSVSSTSTKTALGDVNVNGILTIGDVNTTLAMGNNTLTLVGNYVHTSGAPQISYGANGTFIHTGAAWNIQNTITTFNNLTLSGSGNKTLNTNLTVNGNLVVNSGVTFIQGTNTITGTASKSFTLNSGATHTNAVTASVAIPASFGNYSFASTSTYRLNGIAAQTISSVPQYGNLDISTSGGNATLNGNTTVQGNLLMNGGTPTLADGGFSLTVNGSTVNLRNYVATTGTTLTLGGTSAQTLTNTSPGSPAFSLANLALSGSGSKTSNVTDMVLSGSLTINSGVTFTSNQDLTIAGNLTNNGTLTQTVGTVTFNGSTTQTLNPGATNSIFEVYFTGAGVKNFSGNGLVVGNGNYTVDNTNVNLGSLTHSIASQSVTLIGTTTYTASSANMVFNRAGDQSIPASLNCSNFTSSGSGIKTLSGNLTIANDLVINSGTTLDVDNISNFTISCSGNFTNNGTFQARAGIVDLNSSNTTGKVITSASPFATLRINVGATSVRTYSLGSNVTIGTNLSMFTNSTLELNGRSLTIGTVAAAGTITQSTGSVLTVGPGSSLLFNTTAGNGTLTANSGSTLNIVGTSSSVATVSRSAGNNRIDLNINAGATIGAQYYLIQFLTNEGIDISGTATVDATNNFSNGTFSGINTAGSGGPFRYINFTSTSTSPATDIANVNFNHGTTPVIGQHFNVARPSGSSVINFTGDISGSLGSAAFENDPGNTINWPAITSATWTGAVSTDWFTAGNWSTSLVPNANTNVTIPSATNNPIINATATCRDLTITTGLLQLSSAATLNVMGSVVIGNLTNAGSLIAGSSGVTINVSRNWTRGANGLFSAGNSTVNFNGASGSYIVTPTGSNFFNLGFIGDASYQLAGATITVSNNLSLTAGTLTFATANYNLNIGGNFNRTAGTFSTAVTGTTLFNGTTQNITGGTFSNLTLSGSGVKTATNDMTVAGNLVVLSNLTAASGAAFTFNGTVSINSGATFNGGNSVHTANGTSWTGTGSYTGSGSTVNFARSVVNTTVTINASSFESISFSGTSTININGAITLSNNFTSQTGTRTINLVTHQINSTSGTGTFALEGATTLTLTGSNNFPSGFATYSPVNTSTVNYSGTSAQTIAAVTYGILSLSNANTKTLAGNITVLGSLNIGAATLDVTTNNYRITLAGSFNNNASGSFLARSGEVLFNGTIAQVINLDNVGTKAFYDITVNKTVGTVINPANFNLVVERNLFIQSGTFSANGLVVNVGGDFIATAPGLFAQSGTYVLNRTAGNSAVIQTNNSNLNNLTLTPNSLVTYTLIDNLSVAGNLTMNAGTFEGAGKTIAIGTANNNLNINGGTFNMGEGGILQIVTGGTIQVASGATFRAVGSPSQNVTVTRRGAAGSFIVNINGNIEARYYTFSFLGLTGITLNTGSIIGTTNNFSDGTFTSGLANGIFLRLNNTQSLTGSNRIVNVSFPTNPGAGSFNVSKTISSGNIEFFNATGTFAGPIYENDPNGLIAWTGSITLTWNGSVSTDWFNASNWTPSSGPAIVPNPTTDVVIVSSANNCVISGGDAACNNLTINSSGNLSVSSSSSSNTDLVVAGTTTINGFFLTSSANDLVEVQGNWIRNASGTYSAGSGTIRFNTVSGARTVNNGATAFNNLELASAASVSLASALTVNNNLTIGSGASLDATASNFNLTVGGNIANSGVINMRTNTVTLNATSGTKTISSNSGNFYDLTVSPNSAVTYNLGSNITVTRNLNLNTGTFTVAGYTLSLGDNTTVPTLSVSSTFNLNSNGILAIGSGGAVNVNSGGTFNAVGADISNVATITRLNVSSTPYAFTVNSGASFGAQFYLFEYMNTDGFRLRSGSTLNATNTLQNGTFSNGAATGQYLFFELDFASRVIANVVFNSGPQYNVRRTTGASTVTFEDAAGTLGSYAFEIDELAANSAAGRIRWTSTLTTLTWNGSQTGGFWSDALNWTPNFVPTATDAVILSTSGNAPVINADANALNLTNPSGVTLTITSNANLTIAGSLTNAGIITVQTGSASNISVGGAINNTGTFTNSPTSSVTLNAPSGIQDLSFGNANIQNLSINSGNGSGNAQFRTTGSLTINGNVTIAAGTLLVNNAAHTLTILGNWNQTGGTFTHGNGTVNFSNTGAGSQTITGINTSPFFNITFTGNRPKSLAGTIAVRGTFTVSNGSNINLSNATVNLSGNISNSGTITAGTSTVNFIGTLPQQFTTSAAVTLNNMVMNNTSTTIPQLTLNGPVTIGNGGVLTLTAGRIQTTTINILTLNSTATLSGGSSSSYVTGPIRKVGSANFTYPLGTSSIYARLGISSISSSSTYTAQYFRGTPNNTSITYGGGLQAVSTSEYWDLSRTVGTGTALVTLHWEDGTRSGIGASLTNLRVAHWTGSLWENLGGSTLGTTSAGSVTSTIAASSYSPFTLGSENIAANPLPVVFKYFNGTRTTKGITLNWATASEQNSSFFTVERSVDGKTFEVIGYTDAAGFSNELRTYSLSDVNAPAGTVYYRLQQTDVDGTSQTAPILTIGAGNSDELAVALFPNPTVNKQFTVQLSGLNAGFVTIDLVSVTGQVVSTRTIQATGATLEQGIALPKEVAAGMYNLVVKTADKTVRTRVTVK